MKDGHDIKFFGMSTIGEKGQVVVPAEARKQFGLDAGDKLLVIGSQKSKKLMVVKPEDFKEFASGINNHMSKMLDAIENAEKQ